MFHLNSTLSDIPTVFKPPTQFLWKEMSPSLTLPRAWTHHFLSQLLYFCLSLHFPVVLNSECTLKSPRDLFKQYCCLDPCWTDELRIWAENHWPTLFFLRRNLLFVKTHYRPVVKSTFPAFSRALLPESTILSSSFFSNGSFSSACQVLFSGGFIYFILYSLYPPKLVQVSLQIRWLPEPSSPDSCRCWSQLSSTIEMASESHGSKSQRNEKRF